MISFIIKLKGMHMKKIINWFKDSNRWQHLLMGVLIGLSIPNVVIGTYFSILLGTALEYKDYQWGGKFDWIDLALTSGGGLLGSTVSSIILALCL